MLKADLLFNGLLLVVDLIAFRSFQNMWKRSRIAVFTIVPSLYGFAALILALAVTYYFGLRLFATMRFFGMALFWHSPILLIWISLSGKRILPIIPAIALVALYIYAYHVEPYQLEITNYEFKHSLLRGLQRPVLIAQISDIQADRVGDFEQKVLEKLAGVHPDIIIYTGDYLHCWKSSSYAEQAALLASLLKKTNLRPRFGSFAVMGDSDEPDLWKNVFESQPVKLLEDETVIVPLQGISINLTGLAPTTSRAAHRMELREPMMGSQNGLLPVFIGHSPDYVRALQQLDSPFLALAGHTHGGQVQLPWIGPLLTLTHIANRYADYYGVFGSGVLSVSRGIGMERRDAPRLRFLCRPEIRLITLTGS